MNQKTKDLLITAGNLTIFLFFIGALAGGFHHLLMLIGVIG